MYRHFGVALDPFRTLANLQNEIDDRKRVTGAETLDASWYKLAIQDAFADRYTLELALLRARCDQQDQPLQQLVAQKLQRVAPSTPPAVLQPLQK